MKQNTKFLWLYTIILFTFALVLILIAGLTQNNYKKELAEHENKSRGMQESVSELTARNQELSDQLKAVNAQVDDLKEELDAQKKAQQDAQTAKAAIDKTLLEAAELYEDGSTRAARDMLKDVDRAALDETQGYLYDKINP